MDSFGTLITEASYFVELNKGNWSSNTAGKFLSDIQKKGIELNTDAKYHSYLLMDSMKALYTDISSEIFSKLIELNLKFVEQQKGIWDHTEWLTFLSDIQKENIKLNNDTKDSLGLVLDATRLLYIEKAKYKDLIELAGLFVEQQKGAWGHTEWLEFLSDIRERNIELNDDSKKYLGLVLEHMRDFYNTSSSVRGKENAMLDIAKNTVKFMIEKRFIWGDPEWVEFLSRIQRKGIEITTEKAKNIMGNILDSAKKFMEH